MNVIYKPFTMVKFKEYGISNYDVLINDTRTYFIDECIDIIGEDNRSDLITAMECAVALHGYIYLFNMNNVALFVRKVFDTERFELIEASIPFYTRKDGGRIKPLKGLDYNCVRNDGNFKVTRFTEGEVISIEHDLSDVKFRYSKVSGELIFKLDERDIEGAKEYNKPFVKLVNDILINEIPELKMMIVEIDEKYELVSNS
jgi:hypothetical protein